MVNAYGLIPAERGKTRDVFQKVRSVEGVKLVELVAGLHDIAASIETDSIEKLTNEVIKGIQALLGVARTTLIVVEH